ncbi:MAG: carboxypeptidase-like regulatory domain-containing protein, partial [Longimicrobiales bacterium]
MLDLGVRWLAPAVGALLWGASAGSAQEVRLQALDDGAGAAVADVEIAFVDVGGGLVWRGITDAAGSVVAGLDEPGVYRIRASHPGFQPWESE